MKSARLLNFATPWGWALAGLALLAFGGLCVVALGGVGFRFDPFNLMEKRVVSAEGQAATSAIVASARSHEAAGARDTTARVERALDTIRQADAVAADSNILAREAPDAIQPLDPGQRDRLAAADQRLCAIDPTVCDPDPAASGNAGDG